MPGLWRPAARALQSFAVKRILLAQAAILAFAVVASAARPIHGFLDPMPTAKLKQLFPGAVAFTPRGEVEPVHFTAYAVDPKTPGAKPVGYAFWTIDLVPAELGYHGHIHMLIGMTTAGRIAGVIVDVNTEPYGEISIERPDFPLQFTNKSIRDKFVAGEDVDIVSRATITVRAAAREIRESSRMVARALLSPDAIK